MASLLAIDGLKVQFPVHGGIVRAVDGVSVGVGGESQQASVARSVDCEAVRGVLPSLADDQRIGTRCAQLRCRLRLVPRATWRIRHAGW